MFARKTDCVIGFPDALIFYAGLDAAALYEERFYSFDAAARCLSGASAP